MRISRDWLNRRIACCLVVLLAVPVAEAAAPPPLEESCGQQVQNASSALDQSPQPDSKSEKPGAEAPQSATSDQSGQSSTTQPTSNQQKTDSQKPLGTAAAPYEKTTGVAGSRPAGAVIAPAKQKRARSIFIRVSVIVGAAVAVGTVAALSRSSPSRP
jgi:cobalamin biosynthesis Mg chelatase CobN